MSAQHLVQSLGWKACESYGGGNCSLLPRFTFSLSPGQRPLQTECKMLLKPKIGIFVTPILRGE